MITKKNNKTINNEENLHENVTFIQQRMLLLSTNYLQMQK